MPKMKIAAAPRREGSPPKSRRSPPPVTIADRLQNFIGQCTATDMPANTSENYKKMLLALTKKRYRQAAR